VLAGKKPVKKKVTEPDKKKPGTFAYSNEDDFID
jgi:hypothetical protein